MKSELFRTAWQMLRGGLFTNFANALKCAWQKVKAAQNLISKMRAGVVEFSFTKIDGTERKAKGTLNSSLFSYQHKTTDSKKNASIVVYYDMEANGFRSFKLNNLITF